MPPRYDESYDETIDREYSEWLREEQMRKGICSDTNCHWPIAGWCVGCRAKLCQDHLHEHLNLHAREVAHASLQRGEGSGGDGI